MYEIFLFSGGVYRFDELEEAVEDLGGLVLKKDHFLISRGSSFLGEEIQVLLIVPEQDEKIIESLSDGLKGRLDELELEEPKKIDLLTYISVCDALIRSGSWLTAAEIETLIECPCPAQLCELRGIEACVFDELDETLNKLCAQNILKSREKNDRIEYRLQNDDQ
jgi:hypothetical protein